MVKAFDKIENSQKSDFFPQKCLFHFPKYMKKITWCIIYPSGVSEGQPEQARSQINLNKTLFQIGNIKFTRKSFDRKYKNCLSQISKF